MESRCGALRDIFCCSQGNNDEGGTWYRKSDTAKEDTLGSQKGKTKKEEKEKTNSKQQGST